MDLRSIIGFIFAVMLFADSSAFAKASQDDSEKPRDTMSRARSRDLRQRSSGAVVFLAPTFGFISNDSYGLFDYGIGANLYNSSDLALGLSVRAGVPTKEGHGTIFGVSSGGVAEAYSFDTQYFLGNSFFGRGAIELRYYRTTVRDGKYHSEARASDDYYTYDRIGISSHNDLGLAFGVGNNWILGEHFVFGAEWASIYVPLIGIKNHWSADELKDEKLVKDTNSNIRRGIVWYLPRLHLGYAF